MESVIVIVLLPIIVGLIVRINTIYKYVLLTTYVFFISVIIISSMTLNFAIESNFIYLDNKSRQINRPGKKEVFKTTQTIDNKAQDEKNYIENEIISSEIENKKEEITKKNGNTEYKIEKNSKLKYWQNQNDMFKEYEKNIYRIEKSALNSLKSTYSILKEVKKGEQTMDDLSKSALISITKCDETIKKFEKIKISSKVDKSIKSTLEDVKKDMQTAYYIRKCALNNGLSLLENKNPSYALKIKKELDLSYELLCGCRKTLNEVKSIIDDKLNLYSKDN